MRCTDAGRALVAPALISILFLAACADAPTSPAAPRAPHPPRPQASLASYSDAAALTVWDEGGTGYTLHPSLSEIHATDGTIFELDASELADAMTAFVAAHEGDRASNALASVPPWQNSYCALEVDGCEPEYAYSEGAAGPMPVSGDDIPPQPPPAGGFIVRRAEAGAPATLPSPDFDTPFQVGSCQDIAVAIYDATQQHRAARGAVINVLKAAAGARVVVDGVSLRVKLASVAGLSFALEVAAHGQLARTTQLNILATLYGAYGCWSGSWGSPGSVGGTYFPPPTPVYKSCHREIWEVSTDGGRSWSTQEVEVCEYYMD